jgi:hypothetical protein
MVHLVYVLSLFTLIIILGFSHYQAHAISNLQENNTQPASGESRYMKNSANLTVGIVKPSFTIAAYGQLKPDNPEPIYNRSFYNFYKPYYDILDTGKRVTTDLEEMTVKISPKASSLMEEYLPRYMKVMPDIVKEVFPNSNVSYLNDESIHNGNIFEQNNLTFTNTYDILIIYHEEYVTSQEYHNFKKFVQNGGTLIVMDGNIFYGEVKYDRLNDLLTLVEGHGVKFDGNAVTKSVRERWENETKIWLGSNFYEFSNRQYGPVFVNNPFNYTTVEDMYINNPNVKIILDYGSSDPRYKIATYEINYGKGKIITLGIFGSSVSEKFPFQQFMKELLIAYALPTSLNNSTITDGNHYFHIPPLLQFTPSSNESKELSIQIVENGSNTSPVFRMDGSTYKHALEFRSQDLNYTGKNISLSVGKTFKYGEFLYPKNEPRVIFSYDIQGKKSTYKVDLVHGKPIEEGWANNTYHKMIKSGSTVDVNFEKLLSMVNDEFVSVTNVIVTVEKDLVLNPLEFRFIF